MTITNDSDLSAMKLLFNKPWTSFNPVVKILVKDFFLFNNIKFNTKKNIKNKFCTNLLNIYAVFHFFMSPHYLNS